MAVNSDPSRRQRRPSTNAAGAPALPEGTVTFFMTDVESSTQVWVASPKAAKQAMDRHDRIIVERIERSRGQMVESGREGDSVLAVFRQATDAVACAVDVQRALHRESWPAGAEMRVRIVLHTGEAELTNGHYAAFALYRCARIMAAGHGGQVLLSAATEEIVADALPEGITLRDLGPHRLRDLSRPEHVYQLLHPDLPRDFPPLKSLSAFPNNLPNLLTTFVDREADVRALTTLLRSSRMVTLTGTGGVGKSRLAIEVAKAGADLWPDGRWWIELSAADDVANALAARLELPARGPALEVVSTWLSSKRALLVLDNCEHMVDACATVCEALLERTSDLAVLATSREPLGVHGEARWPLAALGEPDALSLFEARAMLVRPDFKAAGSRSRTISEICRRVDRLPLAIEMAAARLDMMSESELLEDLSSRFRLLASSARTAPERQQTMTATIDWSHRLLTGDEARLFRRLAVFHGGFTMDAAEAVCAEDGSDAVLAVLSGLVRKSMVVADRLGDGSTRYRLLESHHDFATERLREAGEMQAMQRRHFDYFSSRHWEPSESANLWRAVSWGRDHAPDGGLALALEISDSDFGDQTRAAKLILDLLEESKASEALRVKAMTMAARLAWRKADHAAARSLADAAVSAARKVGDAELLARSLNGAGLVHETSGELAIAGERYDEALSLLNASTEWRLAADISNARGLLAITQHDAALAVQILSPAVAAATSHEDPPRLARYLESLANAQLDLREVDAAASSWKQALSIFAGVHDWFGIIWSLVGLSLVAAARHEEDRTLRLAAAATRLSREYSLTMWPYRARQLEAAVGHARARLAASARDEAVWNEGLAMTVEETLDYALTEYRPVEEDLADGGLLSRREREVVTMVAAGMTNREIAQRLFIAERTAEGHVERIRNKLGVRSRTEVATWATARGLHRLDKPPGESKV